MIWKRDLKFGQVREQEYRRSHFAQQYRREDICLIALTLHRWPALPPDGGSRQTRVQPSRKRQINAAAIPLSSTAKDRPAALLAGSGATDRSNPRPTTLSRAHGHSQRRSWPWR